MEANVFFPYTASTCTPNLNTWLTFKKILYMHERKPSAIIEDMLLCIEHIQSQRCETCSFAVLLNCFSLSAKSLRKIWFYILVTFLF